MKRVVNDLVKIIRKYELDYNNFNLACSAARQECELKPKKSKQSDRKRATYDEFRTFLKIIEKEEVKDRLMFKIFTYMGLRCFELTNLKIQDIDLTVGREKMFVERKQGRDRYFCIPRVLVEILKIYIATRDTLYLFEPAFRKKYSERAIRKKITKYREEAGVSPLIHSHAFRSKLVTFLSEKGWSTRQISLVTGHEIGSTVDIYDERNPESIRVIYNEAMNEYSELLYSERG
ncbi:tyrosine-type recombinase/integrase [Candidatus Dependentiae bacterium]|nr:tyrosine-type recombinase/integrase [Candidatus Dependentiae bacterium]